MATRKRVDATGLSETTPVATVVPTPSLVKALRTTTQRARKRPPGRPTADQSNELREHLVNAALQSFMERGFDGSSIESIGRDAKVAKITIYRQFGDKESLFRAVVHHGITSIRDDLAAVSITDKDPGTGLRKLILQMYQINARPDILAIQRLVIAEAKRFPEVALSMLDNAYYSLEPVIDYLDRLRSEKQIFIESSRMAALQLAALAIGGMRPLMRDPSTDPLNQKRWVESVYMTLARAWGLEPVPGPAER